MRKYTLKIFKTNKILFSVAMIIGMLIILSFNNNTLCIPVNKLYVKKNKKYNKN